ncbi:hypothetical protein ACJX0J_025196 [Zea mays]
MHNSSLCNYAFDIEYHPLGIVDLEGVSIEALWALLPTLDVDGHVLFERILALIVVYMIPYLLQFRFIQILSFRLQTLAQHLCIVKIIYCIEYDINPIEFYLSNHNQVDTTKFIEIPNKL